MKTNTNEMRNIAKEINNLANEYQTKISKMYTKFTNMPFETKEWTGNQANRYVNYVLLDKPDLLSVGNKLKDFSKIINATADLLEKNDLNVREDEAND